MATNEDGKKKGLNPLIAIAAAAVIAAASGVAAFALSPGGADKGEPKESSDAHGADEKKAAADGHGKKSSDHGSGDSKSKKKKGKDKNVVGTVYVPIEPIVVSLGPEASARRLKITIVIEGAAAYEGELTGLVPKFRDVLNTYLRAADARDFESPAAMSRIRAHIARRLTIVAPEDSIEGVLVTDFILD